MLHFQMAKKIIFIKVINSYFYLLTLLLFYDMVNYQHWYCLFTILKCQKPTFILLKETHCQIPDWIFFKIFPLKLSLPHPEVSDSATEKQWCFLSSFVQSIYRHCSNLYNLNYSLQHLPGVKTPLVSWGVKVLWEFLPTPERCCIVCLEALSHRYLLCQGRRGQSGGLSEAKAQIM